MDAWKTGLAGQTMTRSASLEGRKRGRPHTKLPVPDCVAHGDVLTRGRKVGLTDVENLTPQSLLCDHHAVDGSPQKMSSYGYNELLRKKSVPIGLATDDAPDELLFLSPSTLAHIAVLGKPLSLMKARDYKPSYT